MIPITNIDIRNNPTELILDGWVANPEQLKLLNPYYDEEKLYAIPNPPERKTLV